MTTKKSYTAPQLFEVALDKEQAVLSACSLTARTLSNSMPGGCRPGGAGNCKSHSGAAGRDSGPRAS